MTYRCCPALFLAFLVQVTAPAPHPTGKLLAISPDTAEFMAAVTLHETSLSFVDLCPDYNMAKACQFEYLEGLPRPRQGYEEEMKVSCECSFCR
jgi:hypothetical protein